MKSSTSILAIALLLTGTVIPTFGIHPVEASETIYIRADGSIDPPTAPLSTADNVTYTLTNNITFGFGAGVVVLRDNVVIEGDGYAVLGTAYGVLMDLAGRSNVTVRNIRFSHPYGYVIHLDHSSNNTIGGNTIADSYSSIRLNNSPNNRISGNTIAADPGNSYAIYLNGSAHNNISSNNITANSDGIMLQDSSGTNISRNSIIGNFQGITLRTSSNCSVRENNITANTHYGILLYVYSNNNIINSNRIAGSEHGVWLYASSNNRISGNNITSNTYGVKVDQSFDNMLFHNNIVNNSQQVIVVYPGYGNVWDAGYPLGGNYWSDSADVDVYGGEHQNETGSDGFWDHPYVIDADNQDRYPLTTPYGPPIGDVDGDFDVDMFDVTAVCSRYGCHKGDPRWSPRADMAPRWGIIDIFDCVTVAYYYGKHAP